MFFILNQRVQDVNQLGCTSHIFSSQGPRRIGCPVREEREKKKMSELSDEASESEQLSSSLSVWLGDSLVRPEELDVPLDLHTACSIGQYDVVAECIKK